jgi:hypothetical protein
MRKTERVTVFKLRERPGLLVPEKEVLVRIFETALKRGRHSASNWDSDSL